MTDTKPSNVEGLVEAMRDDPYMDDAHLLGTTTQDARMTHYAEIAAAHFSTTLAAQQARIEALERDKATLLTFAKSIQTWREDAGGYDRECNNPARTYCEDVELMEKAAGYAMRRIAERTALKEPS